MAIGTIGAIALGVGALGSAQISAGASGKASNAASQAADASAQVHRETYAQNAQTLAPFVQTGTQASGAINSLLGLGGPQTPTQPTPQAGGQMGAQMGGFPGYANAMANAAGYGRTAPPSNFADYVRANPDLQAEFQQVAGQFGNNPAAYGQYHWNTYGQNEGRTLPGTAAAAPATAPNAQAQYQSAFDNYRNSTGYQFRLGEGMNALNSGYAGAGTIKSGAAMKAATEYGQNFASNEFGNYLSALGNQQGVGLSAAGAQAGVGTNYANSLTQINSNKADAIGNAALANAGNINSMVGTLGAGILKYG